MKKYLVPGLLAAVFLVTFYPAFTWMYMRFTAPGSYYTHGFLIPFISAFLIYRKKDELRKITPAPSPGGLILILFGLALHILGGIMFGIGFASGISLIIVLLGISLYIFGKKITGKVLFPVLFLIFMVPLPEVLLISLTFRMKMDAARMGTAIVTAMNIPAERAGSIIHLPNGILTVGDECSGINSLISLVTLSTLFGYLADVSLWKKVSFVLLAVPVALIANTGRVVFLIIAAFIYGIEAAGGDLIHYGSGMFLWMVALAILVLVWRFFKLKACD